MPKTRESIGVTLAILRERKTLVEQAIRSLEALHKMQVGHTATRR